MSKNQAGPCPLSGRSGRCGSGLTARSARARRATSAPCACATRRDIDDIRCGSCPVMTASGQWHALPHRSISVRFTPVSGIDSRSQALPSRAITGPEQVQQIAWTNRGYSMTSSARASSVGGTSRPSTLAVVRLMTRSNLVGCSTGISAGFVPRRILSTNSAARRNRSVIFGP
jgi:hypothetical protein